MAHHKSAKKRIRQSEKRRVHNKYYAKTMRNALRKVRGSEDQSEVAADMPKLVSMIDRLAKKNIIHWKKAANLKSKLAKNLNKM